MKISQISATALAIVLLPGLAHAYIGPGAGISAIGAAFALVAAVFFAIVGFIWYPVKRLLRRRSKAAEPGPQEPGDDAG